MSEKKWTPGPWKVDEEARVGGYGIQATPSAYTHVTVAVSIQSEGCSYPISSAEARDNARLIAAAPELYAAVAAVIAATGEYLPPDGISKEDFISRVIAATDNDRMAEIME